MCSLVKFQNIVLYNLCIIIKKQLIPNWKYVTIKRI